ncbi:hypothetical protein Tco_0408615 [Tanacetum coccineum]
MTPIYSLGSSSTPIYSLESSTPPRYSSGASSPQNYSPGPSRNAECSNCKHLLEKITVLEATVEMYMHPEQHILNSAALLHEVYNDTRKLVITEYLVNISKRCAFWSLNKDILKITILTTNTPYPSRKIRRIRAYTHQRPQRKEDQYAVSREDQYAVLDIWHVNILEDIKRGPYSKKPQYAVSNPLDTPYQTDFQSV